MHHSCMVYGKEQIKQDINLRNFLKLFWEFFLSSLQES